MPFVQRNWKGEITGLFSGPQLGEAEEELPEDHPDVAAFRSSNPIPDGFLRTPTLEEIERSVIDHERNNNEHVALREEIWSFNVAFNNWEIALSALLYSALNLNKSQVAYAIYYSPTGFDARISIINNVIQQLILENPRLSELGPLWKALHDQFGRPKTVRNQIAHGMPITLVVNGRSHVRLTAPAFDQNRVGRQVAKTGQAPGLSSDSIRKSAEKIRWLCERVDELNRLFSTFYENGNPTLPEKFATLKAGLQTTS